MIGPMTPRVVGVIGVYVKTVIMTTSRGVSYILKVSSGSTSSRPYIPITTM